MSKLGDTDVVFVDLFVCNLGWRSALAADIVRRMGLRTCHIDGGFEAWKAAGEAVSPR